MCWRDLWRCAAPGTDISFGAEGCCWRGSIYPVAWNKHSSENVPGQIKTLASVCAEDLIPLHTLWAQSCHRLPSGPSLLPLWQCHCSSHPPRSGTWVSKQPHWQISYINLLFVQRAQHSSCTHLVSRVRVPIFWGCTSALTSTSTEIAASLHFHSPRPKMTSCLGRGSGMWTWKHLRFDLLRSKISVNVLRKLRLEKTSACGVSGRVLPEELTGSVAQGPEDVEVQAAHVVDHTHSSRLMEISKHKRASSS